MRPLLNSLVRRALWLGNGPLQSAKLTPNCIYDPFAGTMVRKQAETSRCFTARCELFANEPALGISANGQFERMGSLDDAGSC